ncbi:hypothetical protein D7X87_02735 [bacterium D16-54]|nr:hypothetical protein D7X87_02735 [bacterium D16-54]RKJ16551.1 hypothetical protein D7X65_02735 [bacterium D16-56]
MQDHGQERSNPHGDPRMSKNHGQERSNPHGDPRMSKNHGQERSNPPWGSQDVQKPWTEKE